MTPGAFLRICIGLFGGVGLFIYGMKTVGWGLQKVAGRRLRNILGTLTNTPIKGTVIGALMTATIQSSSATTVMLVGFVNASLMTLSQAIGVVYGANIGTTFTVQLIAFNVSNYSLLLVGIGVMLLVFKRNRIVQYLGQSLLGFGLIFLGIKVLMDSTEPLRSYPLFLNSLVSMEAYPIVAIAISAVFTGIIHSSAAAIGISMVLASQGMMDLPAAIPILLGADIGTCSTAILSSLGSSREGKRVAVAHLLFNLIGALLVYPFMDLFREAILWMSDPFAAGISRQIANGHMLFKVLNTMIFLPFTVPFRKIITFMIPIVPELERTFEVRYLDEQVLDTPEIALGQAGKEAERMGNRVLEMFRQTILVFQNGDDFLREEIKKMDNEIDYLDDAITRYLISVAQGSLTEDQSRREISLLNIVDNLEHVGDLIDKSLMELARKKIDFGLHFSSGGEQDIILMHGQIYANLQKVVSAFVHWNAEQAKEVLHQFPRIDKLESDLRKAHIQRLHNGLQETIDTSSIHLDVISSLKQINTHAESMAKEVAGEN